jgi:hypothetical protein
VQVPGLVEALGSEAHQEGVADHNSTRQVRPQFAMQQRAQFLVVQSQVSVAAALQLCEAGYFGWEAVTRVVGTIGDVQQSLLPVVVVGRYLMQLVSHVSILQTMLLLTEVLVLSNNRGLWARRGLVARRSFSVGWRWGLDRRPIHSFGRSRTTIDVCARARRKCLEKCVEIR